VVLDCLDPSSLVAFWSAALGYRLADTLGDYRVLVPDEGEPPGPPLVLQRVPEPRVAKNRMHLDVHPADPEAHIARLLDLGATLRGDRVAELGMWWQVLADPEGNELCVVAHPA
jgi:hypothetical protein